MAGEPSTPLVTRRDSPRGSAQGQTASVWPAGRAIEPCDRTAGTRGWPSLPQRRPQLVQRNGGPRSSEPRRLRLREPWASQIGQMWPPCGRRSSCRGLSSFFNGSQSLLNAIVIRSVRLPSISEQRGGQRGHNRYTSTVGGSDPLVWVRMARTRSCGPLSLSLPPALALSPRSPSRLMGRAPGELGLESCMFGIGRADDCGSRYFRYIGRATPSAPSCESSGFDWGSTVCSLSFRRSVTVIVAKWVQESVEQFLVRPDAEAFGEDVSELRVRVNEARRVDLAGDTVSQLVGVT